MKNYGKNQTIRQDLQKIRFWVGESVTYGESISTPQRPY